MFANLMHHIERECLGALLRALPRVPESGGGPESGMESELLLRLWPLYVGPPQAIL